MATQKAAAQKEPVLPPEKAVKVIIQQLESLQNLKGRCYEETHAAETEWDHMTRGFIEAAFGNPSSELDRFFMARAAGIHNRADQYQLSGRAHCQF